MFHWQLAVWDKDKEVAYETAVLGTLRPGYRCFRLRSSRFGTRIEMCTMFVHISIGSEPHMWAKTDDLRHFVLQQQAKHPINPPTTRARTSTRTCTDSSTILG